MNLKKWLATALTVAVLQGASVGMAMAAVNPPAAENPEQVFLDNLAGNLGVDRGKLDDALKAASNQMVDQALKDGKITQEQADHMRSRINEGTPLVGIMGMEHGKHRSRGGFLKPLADILGMTPQDVKSALKSGKTVADLAAAKGMTVTQLQDQMLTNLKNRLDKAVKDGKLTQSIADQIYSRKEQNIKSGDWIKQLEKCCKTDQN